MTSKHYLAFLARLMAVMLMAFAVGKIFFLAYNQSIFQASMVDTWQVWMHGLAMDLSTAGYLLVLPWLASVVNLWWTRLPLRAVLLPYYAVVALLLGTVVLGDAYLYEFWKFKLNAAVFSYMQSVDGVANSVGLSFVLSRLLLCLLFAAAIGFALFRATPRRLQTLAHRPLHSVALVLVGGVLFLCIRGSVGASTMNVGVAYYSPNAFLNHAAVNPAFSLMSSVSKHRDFGQQFRFFSPEKEAELMSGLYPPYDPSLTDTLLCTPRPNVLLILLEGFGGKMVEQLGGVPGVAPQLGGWSERGVFWDQFYSNSFRTDRGLVSALSGWVSYPTASLMKLPHKLSQVPSLAHSLQGAGYATHFVYGGDTEYMGLKGYLVASGYQHITTDHDFSLAQARESKWGVNDGQTMLAVHEQIQQMPHHEPWMLTWLTLSSHEPFEVPYQRLSHPALNAFAFTDSCVGALLDHLSQQPQVWNNLLVVILPDHGFLHETTYQDPDFFHCPMWWVGGAVRQPRRISTLMNQSDMAATLLAQMQISHADYPWSRNVLGREYRYPFAYSTYPGGILWADSTGVSIWDIASQQSIAEHPTASPQRIERARATLQHTYTHLGQMQPVTTQPAQ